MVSLLSMPIALAPSWYKLKAYPLITVDKKVVIFQNAESYIGSGQLQASDITLPSGPPVMVDGYTMIPLEGGGAVQANQCRAAMKRDKTFQ